MPELPPVKAGLKRYWTGGAVGEGEAWDLAPYQYESGEDLDPQLFGKTLFSADDIFSEAQPSPKAMPESSSSGPPSVIKGGGYNPSVFTNYMYGQAGTPHYYPLFGHTGPNMEAYWAPPFNEQHPEAWAHAALSNHNPNEAPPPPQSPLSPSLTSLPKPAPWPWEH